MAALLALAVALPAGLTVAAPTAGADSAPVDPSLPATVTTDVLPTTQINGVAWDQVIVGNTVYVAGSFSSARPAGAAAGTNETPRRNLLAYNLTTGALVTTWAPTLNAQARTIGASADGSTIYVGGDFSQANGTARGRIAAFDAATGALRPFVANANSNVNDLTVSGSTVYAVGSFTVVNNQARARAVAVDATSGALRPWNPSADRELRAVVAPAGTGKVVVGGHLSLLNGVDTKGMGAVDATTGSLLPWPVNQVLVNYGNDAAIWSLSTNGTQVFGTGMTYLVNGVDTGNFEATFAASAATGELQWVNGCRGDHYDAFPVGDVLYSVSHAHDCGMVGGHPQTEPWTFQMANASTTYRSPDGATNTYERFAGQPASKLLHWLPNLSLGSVTGQYQAGWTVEGSGRYVVLGGEFPRVNGIAQAGLVRFATSDVAPDRDGPQGASQSTPSLVALAPGTLRVAWRAAWDRDNTRLTYEVRRGATAGSAVTIRSFTADTNWWSRPNLSFTDTTAPPGSTQTYRIRVTDPFGNTFTSSPATATVPAGQLSASAYKAAVLQDLPDRLWRLGESGGALAYDHVGADDLTLDASAQRGVAGALTNETESATRLPGTASVPGSTTGSPAPGPNRFAVEAWINTTTTTGGKILGFGDQAGATSNNYDRHLYMGDDGRVRFGVYDGNTRTVSSGRALNDGQWHHVVASLGDDGIKLYVDGSLVGADPTATVAQPYSGFWRLGGDNLNGWPDQPSTFSFAGSVDEVAVYGGPLGRDRIRAHYLASGRAAAWPQAPSDSYGAAVWADAPSWFLRLDETSGTAALDRATNTSGGTFEGSYTLGRPGSPANAGGTSVRLDGSAARVVASNLTANPQTFSIETWIRTTTSQGGRIVGFGSGNGESSNNYDRHLYMLDDGRLRYGVWTGQVNVIDTTASYNDGNWHHVVVSHQPGDQRMYVDGQLVGTMAAPFAEGYDGYWRIGNDNTWGGASSNEFRGDVDETAIYPSALGQSAVQAHYAAAGGVTPNQPPTASFTSSVNNLTASVDASGSSDPDGSIVSYAWDFGDGSTGSGVTAQRTYATAGTYTVRLTVTDDRGATASTTRQVTVLSPNQLPTSSFTWSALGLTASFNGAGSTDPDGSIVSYAWDFGDGGTGTGVTAQRTYAAGGSYTVRLTVTDDRGATAVSTATVTVTAPQGPVTVASDTFNRTLASGWGAADLGGSWTTVGAATNYSVSSGVGRMTASGPASQRTAYLNGVQQSSVDLRAAVSVLQPSSGGGTFLSVIGRSVAGNDYRLKLRVQGNGTVDAFLTRIMGGVETTLQTRAALLSGYTPGQVLRVRLQVTGTAPTTINAKVWTDGAAEPAAWQLQAQDATAALQAAGAVGVQQYLSSSATVFPVTVTVDDVSVRTPAE